MVRRYTLLLVACGTCLGATWAFYGCATADEKPATGNGKGAAKKKDAPAPSRKAHAELMRKKLNSAQTVLEGMVLEDFGLMMQGAQELKKISTAAEFNVIDFGEYSLFADKFRRVTEKLEKKAKEKNLDGATLAYIDMTMSCVECHKYVRVVPLPQ